LIDANRLPHLLFYGPPGTGKTTTILALARKLYGPAYQSMVLELNASDDRGIDVVREQIKSFAGTRKLFSTGVKLIVLDEADNMTNDAQFALRRVIEKYTRNTRFCLICNYVSRIIPALQSRCTRFRFAPLKRDDMEARMRYVVDCEGLGARVSADGMSAILRLAGGDMRKVLNVLQATASGFDRVDAATVHLCTGNPSPAEIRTLLDSFMNKSLSEGYADLNALTHRGFALSDILNELARYVPQITLPSEALRILMERMADIEYRLAFGTSEKLQGASLVAAFTAAKDAMAHGGK
jgi:replication factor C subunit 3/5